MTDRELLLVMVKHADEDTLLRLIPTLEPPLLVTLMRNMGIEDCSCPVQIEPCGCDGPCECSPFVIPCPHLAAAKDYMPFTAQIALMWAMFEADFKEPPMPDRASKVTQQAAMANVMAHRHADGKHLRHPWDILQRMVDWNDKLGRLVHRLRNGVARAGGLVLAGG